MLSVKSSFGGFTSPYVYKIPADTVIFYNGTYSAPVDGWSIYSAASNNLIIGTATQGEVGVATGVTGSTVATVTSLATAGLHYGSEVNSVGGAGSLDRGKIETGDHTHTVTPSSVTVSTDMRPVSTTITMLRTTAEQQFFPTNTIHIGATNLFSGTQKLAATSDRYVSGGSTVADNAAVTHTATFTVSSYNSDSHDHMPYLGAQGYVQTGATGGGAATSRYLGGSSSNHSHALTASASITALKGKLLKLWITASKQLPRSSMVVMYCGDISTLPSYWKICDGTNGTVDMRGYFLGYATSSATAHGTVTSETNTYATSGPTVASDNYTHQHYALSTSNLSSLGRPHTTESFPHTHAVSGGSLTTDAIPANIKLAFIQLVI
tara:strand:- start:206 stop:1342 length:1137 start_codon:yes stop_codon:yes gene_type:complete